MISTIKPVKVKRRYHGDEWRPYFAWLPCRLVFSLPGAPRDVNGDQERVCCWVWLAWIETKPRDNDGRSPWIYRLKEPE